MTFDEWWKTQGLDNEWVKSWARDAWIVAQVQCDLEDATPPEVDARDPIEKARDTLTETTRALKMIRFYCEVHSSPWDVAACKHAEEIIRSLPMYRSEPQSSEETK